MVTAMAARAVEESQAGLLLGLARPYYDDVALAEARESIARKLIDI